MDVDPHRQRAAVGVPELRGDVRRRPTVAITGADGVLILRRAAKRSPADAARIASRVLQHVENSIGEATTSR